MSSAQQRLSGYQRRLFFFLSVATFFEGFDQIAITQLLPNIREEMQLSEGEGGLMIAVINIGTVLAYALVRRADRWGRRRVLAITILGYTLFSFLSGLASNVWLFTAFQLLGRMFLIGEWAVSMVYAAEEFPAERRGMVIGVITGMSAFGSVVCAGLVPVMISLPFGWSGWRNVYFAGTLPLLLLAFARRSLKETARFESLASTKVSVATTDFLRIMRSPHRRRVLQLALIWALTYLCTQTSVTFWKEFAMAERGMSDADVGRTISLAALGAMPLVFAAGKLLDLIGRRRGAIAIFAVASWSSWAAYSLESDLGLLVAVMGAIFGASAVLPVLNAYTTELFPTAFRGDAFAWANNVLGRTGYVLAPLAVGFAAEDIGWGAAVSATAVFPLVALALMLWWLPETRGKELEQTAGL